MKRFAPLLILLLLIPSTAGAPPIGPGGIYGGGGATTMSDLTDTAGATTSQIMGFNGTSWAPTDQAGAAGGDPDQNLWDGVIPDTGVTVTADGTTGNLTITGGNHVSTDGSDTIDTVTISVVIDTVLDMNAYGTTDTGPITGATTVTTGTITASDFSNFNGGLISRGNIQISGGNRLYGSATYDLFLSTLSADKAVIVKAAAGQSVNPFKIVQSDNTVLVAVDASGNITTVGAITSQSTISASGTIDASAYTGTWAGSELTNAQVADDITAGTAAALAADPANCSAGSYSTGIAADGTAEGCADPGSAGATTDLTDIVINTTDSTIDMGASNSVTFSFDSQQVIISENGVSVPGTGPTTISGAMSVSGISSFATTMTGVLPSYLSQAGATTGQVIEWTGSIWAPGTDDGAGSGATVAFKTISGDSGGDAVANVADDTLTISGGTAVSTVASSDESITINFDGNFSDVGGSASDAQVPDDITISAIPAANITGSIQDAQIVGTIARVSALFGGNFSDLAGSATDSQIPDDITISAVPAANITGSIQDAQIVAAIARDSEVATAVSDHAALGSIHVPTNCAEGQRPSWDNTTDQWGCADDATGGSGGDPLWKEDGGALIPSTSANSVGTANTSAGSGWWDSTTSTIYLTDAPDGERFLQAFNENGMTSSVIAEGVIVYGGAVERVLVRDSDSTESVAFTSDLPATATSAATGTLEVATRAETETGTSQVLGVSPDGLTQWSGSPQIVTIGTITTGDIDTIAATADSATSGYLEVATIAETNTGTSQVLAVSPDGLEDWTGNAAALASFSATGGGAHAGSETAHQPLTFPVIPGGWFSPDAGDDGIWSVGAPGALTVQSINCKAVGGTMTIEFLDVASSIGTVVCGNGTRTWKTSLTDSTVADQAEQSFNILGITGAVTSFATGYVYSMP